MRTLYAAAALAVGLFPAFAGEMTRDAVREAVADAGAHAARCPAPALTVDQVKVIELFVAANFAKSEYPTVTARLDEIWKALESTPTDVVCRDAEERYGAEGDIVKDLLIAR